MLAIAGFQVYSDPAQATNPQTMATIASGLGLLLAKDAGQAPAAPPEAK